MSSNNRIIAMDVIIKPINIKNIVCFIAGSDLIINDAEVSKLYKNDSLLVVKNALAEIVLDVGLWSRKWFVG